MLAGGNLKKNFTSNEGYNLTGRLSCEPTFTPVPCGGTCRAFSNAKFS